MSQIRLRILGESVIQVGSTTVEPTATHLFALLLHLAIERGKLIPRAQLAGILFPEASASNAAHNLRQLLYRLRRMGVPLETTAAAVRLPAECVAEAPEGALRGNATDPLQGGATSFVLLPGYSPPTRPLSRWLEAYRDEISSILLRRIARDLAKAREGADWTAVERFARALLELDPLNETATLGLAEAMARSGSKHKAVKLLADFAEDVGQSHAGLALPSRLLTRRISEEVQPPSPHSPRAPLVGRAEELRSLTEAWAYARRGHCTIAVVTGEKSIGKSRVLEELCELIRMDGSGVVLASRAQLADAERPMSLFSDMCAALLALPGAAGCSPSSLPHLRRLHGAPSLAGSATGAEFDGPLPEGATRRAVVDLLDSVSSERALLICVDDADQVDDSSRDLLESLPERAPGLPILIVVAGIRTARLPQRRDRTIRLGPLLRDHASVLARGMREHLSPSSSVDLIDWCIDAAAGNPGHLELLVRHTASLRDAPAVPPDLIALLDAQLDSLPVTGKHVLQACVTFGADCCSATIAALTGVAGYELLLSLEELVETGYVIDSESGISCRSSLLAERVRRSMTPVVRKLLHRRAAEYLECLSESGWTTQATAWRIADHWQAAGSRAQALKWRRTCWRQLISIGQPMAAAESIRSYLPSSSSDLERAALLDDLIHALQHGSDIDAQLSALGDRVALSDRVGDTSAIRLRLVADTVEARFQSFEDTTQLLPELQALLASTELDEMRRLRAARILMTTADSLLDEPLAQAVCAALPREPRSTNASLFKAQVELIFHTVFGDRAIAIRLAHSIALLAEKQELSSASVSAQLTAALALRIVDDKAADISKLERLFARCLASEMHDAAIRTSARIGSIHFEDGTLDAARNWGQRASDLIAQIGVQRLSSDFITLQIDLALEEGDLPSAQRLLESAPHCCPIYASPRWSREYLVYRLRVAQHRGDSGVSRRDIECLMDWHNRAKHLGRHDDDMEVLWTALWRAGRRAEASSLLRDYLNNARRERRPVSFMLHSRTREDSVWNELSRRGDGLASELPQPRI